MFLFHSLNNPCYYELCDRQGSIDFSNVYIVLLCSQVQCLVAVLHLQTFRLMQPIFRFPNHVKFKRINMHVHTHVIFVYGSQVRHQSLKKHKSAVGSKEASTSLLKFVVFCERVLSIFLVNVIAAIIGFYGSGRLRRERHVYLSPPLPPPSTPNPNQT